MSSSRFDYQNSCYRLSCYSPGYRPGRGRAQQVNAAAGTIEEIIVTARYRAEALSDVPDSITAFTIDDIKRYRIERINRVASLTPNLRFSDDQEVGVSTLVIRGSGRIGAPASRAGFIPG